MTIIVFGDDGGRTLLGAVTLEEMGLGVDPPGQKLIGAGAADVAIRWSVLSGHPACSSPRRSIVTLNEA